MEYANSGTLRNYLKDCFEKLTWSDKLNLSLQLANAVSCLHEEEIVHRDLVINICNIILQECTVYILNV
jgi:serine/threonine protein kinase